MELDIHYLDNKVVINNIKNFNIKQICECGQCFRWKKEKENNYIGVAYGRVIEVLQEDDTVTIYNASEEDFKNIWIKYFDLERDYSKIKYILSQDEILKVALEYGYGIRILNQDPFELVISYIISARNSIPVISKTINNICEAYGKKLDYKGKIYYAFPTIEELSKASVEEIKNLGGSFRSKYIVDTTNKIYMCNLAKEKKLDESKEIIEELLEKYDLEKIKNMSDNDCHKALQEFKGIGAKVSDCIMLFSMQKYSAFPVDIWVKRAMIHFYGANDTSLNKIRVFAREKFGELSGFAQQYLFYYAREKGIKF
ncbi:MAG: DNA glycosylase [Sarcina ventriculi]|uniref:DNA-3-methyladenine glycosylase family protein n=1 Tax=Sarcina ventriculi TaxID=1267 RepID=UPI001C11DBE3|nr:DNA glycosylase [Sarcina ventriculi]MBU5323449.1 8-oxoguanine DNA glycosylase [Sarcina ventriculi]MDD7372298.1 DNA glycosylase [Sarcina ventriculi]MDY7061398.1 DNA glycosylase [Sarcina ventriculi]